MFIRNFNKFKRKLSIYNVYIENMKEYAIIYNTCSGKICKISKPLDIIYNKNVIDLLTQKGFLVDERIDEFQELLNVSRSIAEDTNHPNVDITLAPSLKCNMRCKYCFENGIKLESKLNVITEQTLEDVENFILGIANRESVENLNLIWFGGEPLLESELIIKFSNLIRKKLQPSKQMHVRIITNGLLLSFDMLHSLISGCGLESVQISIDGLQDRYSQTHQVNGRVFEKVVDNIILSSNYIKTTIRLNTSMSNINDIYKLIEMLSIKINRKDNVIFKISEIINYNNIENFPVETYNFGTFRNFYRELARYIHNLGFNQECDYIEGFYPLGCKYYYKNNYVIDPNGNLYKCEHHMGENDFILGNVALGLQQESYCHHIYYNHLIDERCKACNIYPICKYASCQDYRQFVSSTPCNIYTEQLNAIITDIVSNFESLSIDIIN